MTDARSELQRLLATPPPGFDAAQCHKNPVAMAHAALEHVRQAGDPQFLFLRTIIEISSATITASTTMPQQDQELLFHCLTGCRQVVLWKWHDYSPAFVRHVRDYLLVLGCPSSSSSSSSIVYTTRTLRLACLTAVAAFWKRGWNEPPSTGASFSSSWERQDEQILVQRMTRHVKIPILQSKADLFAFLQHIMTMETSFTMQAANFLHVLVGEFAGRSAVEYRLPLEFHREAHKGFESRDKALTKTLSIAMSTLRRVLVQQQKQDSSNYNYNHKDQAEETMAVIQLVSDCLHWEFGMSAWNTGALGASSVQLTLIRPPVAWQDVLLGDNGTIVRMLVETLQTQMTNLPLAQRQEPLAHGIRQLVISFASISGAIFPSSQDRKKYAAFLLQVTVPLLQGVQTEQENSELLDYVQLMGRLVSNFRLSAMAELPALMPMLQTLAALGNQLLADQVKDCERAGGDVESMALREWREEVLKVLLDSAVLLSSDPWLLYSGTDEVRRQAQQQLSAILGPLYEGFVRSRTRMAALEEHYLVSNGQDLDEEEEEIRAQEMEEEMVSVASFGRLNLDSAIACLAAMHSQTMPRLQSLWEGHGGITPEIASLLEEFRLLTMYILQLLTDENKGEQPAIPEAVIFACESNPNLATQIISAVQALLQFSNEQVQKIAQNPQNMRLSPILSKTLLTFIERWAPAYIYPDLYQNSTSTNPIVLAWSSPDKAHEAADFIISLCTSYMCYWPQEKQVHEVVARLLIALARRRGKVRQTLVSCPNVATLVKFHCITAGVRHTASQEEFISIIREKVGHDALPLGRLGGFQRLPYIDRSHVLTFIMIACSEESDLTSNSYINEAMKSVHDAFVRLVQAFEAKLIGPEDINAKEQTMLSLEMFCGIADAGEMSGNERIPHFVTPFLSKLAALMQFYATDLGICEIILRFFRDYTEKFVAVLTKDQTITLFQAVAELLTSYSANHCVNRVIKKSAALANAEEEQAYEDIQTAIQLLVNLGAKDFIDACGDSSRGIESNQVTDVIFLGLQQILPLMTQGLLQLPTLCSQFFDLVGFMMETYPEKVCALPFDLFDSLLQSLLYGMSHHDATVACVSLQGLGSISREHLKTRVLQGHLTSKPDLLDDCIRRLIVEVVVQPLVVDRVEACGMALLPLAAANMNRLGNVIHFICQQVSNEHQRVRLEQAFTKLLQVDMLNKAAQAGFEGRSNRLQFKQVFQEFVNNVHSFLILK